MFKSLNLIAIVLGTLGLALAQERDRSLPLPNPAEIEKERIEKKYDAKTPRLEKGESLEQRQELKILYQYKYDYKPPQRGGLIKGEKVVREAEKEASVVQRQGQGQERESSRQRREVVLKGYCSIDRTYEVSLEEIYVQSECLLNRKPAKAEIVLVPDIANLRLVGKVLSVNGKRVKESMVRTEDKTSFNIADEVDRRLIANILLRSSRETTRGTVGALEELMRNAGRTTYRGTFGDTTTTVDLEKGAKDILEVTPFFMIANLLRASSEEILSGRGRLPTIFRIHKKDLYVEVVMDD